MPRLSARRRSRERVPKGRKACQTFGPPKMMRPQQRPVFVLLGTRRRVFGRSLSYLPHARESLSHPRVSVRLGTVYEAPVRWRGVLLSSPSTAAVPPFLTEGERRLLSCDAPRQLRATPRAVLSSLSPDAFFSLALAFRLRLSLRPSWCARAQPVVTRTRLVGSATASLCVSSAHRDKPPDLGIYSRQPPKQAGCLRNSYFDTGRTGGILVPIPGIDIHSCLRSRIQLESL